MMNKTKLIIKRVDIRRKGISVYNEEFHSGLNVIRGENGTGKSTIMELISYGLGGDVKKQNWKEEALLCDIIFIELDINYKPYVFKRDIEGDSNKPKINIFEGTYEEGLKSLEGWTSYKYRKSDTRKSFAMQIFNLLGYEQHNTSDGDALTIHQLLRLLYVDQDTPASNIFRMESFTYDRESMRKAIGEFLFGFDDLEAHTIRQKKYDAEKKFEKLESDLKAIYRVLGKTNVSASVIEIQNEIGTLIEQLAKIDDQKVIDLEANSQTQSEHLNSELKKTKLDLEVTAKEISFLEERILSLSYEISESNEFIKTIEQREIALKQAQFTVNQLGIIDFDYCPSCLTKISDENKEQHLSCKLCKSSVDTTIVNESYIQALNELDFQRNETRRIIDIQSTERVKLIASSNRVKEHSIRTKAKFNELNIFSSDYEVLITKAANEKGFIEAQIKALYDKIELAEEIETQIDKKSKLNQLITILDDKLKLIESGSAKRKRSVYSDISKTVIDILSQDIGVEDKAFANAKKFEFNFSTDNMILDGRAKFSASSNVILKNAFHLAVLLIAVKDDRFRIPCFTMFDNIEDKGMTETRSRNFQRILAKKCNELSTDYQVIMSTSAVDDSLNNDTYGVGPFYDIGEHTLAI
jgi:ribosomal protein S8